MNGSDDNSLSGAVPLADAIKALRAELKSAWVEGSGEWLKLRSSPVELTLQVAVTSTGGVNGGVKWWLIEFGGEASRESVVTQTIRLTLDPVVFTKDGVESEFLIDAEIGFDDTSKSDVGGLDAPA